jgi:hypothetical protein
MPINTMSKILSPPLIEALDGPVEKMLLNTTVSMQYDWRHTRSPSSTAAIAERTMMWMLTDTSGSEDSQLSLTHASSPAATFHCKVVFGTDGIVYVPTWL